MPQCIKAVRQCSPEDVGGVPRFYDFLEIMEDMAHPDHNAVREWLGGEWFDPEFVDLIELNPEQTRFRKEDKQVMRRTALFEGMFVRV